MKGKEPSASGSRLCAAAAAAATHVYCDCMYSASYTVLGLSTTKERASGMAEAARLLRMSR